MERAWSNRDRERYRSPPALPVEPFSSRIKIINLLRGA